MKMEASVASVEKIVYVDLILILRNYGYLFVVSLELRALSIAISTKLIIFFYMKKMYLAQYENWKRIIKNY
jgi:hypothetical protein